MSGEHAIPYDELERRRKAASAARKASTYTPAEPVIESEAMAAIHEIFNPKLKLPQTTGPYRPPKAASANQFVSIQDLDIRKLAELKEAFLLFDTDGDGLISKEDLKMTFGALGSQVEDEFLEEMLKEAKDPLDVDAFLELMSQRTVELDPEDILLEAWSKWDLYGTGRIEQRNCLDYIEIFPYLREPVVEDITMAEYMFCNYSQSFLPPQPTPSSNFDSINDKRLANLSSTTQIHTTTTRPMFLLHTDEFIYSSHRILAIRVRFNKSLPGAKQLINNWPLQLTGEYRFLKKEHFQNDGRLIKNSYCDYYFFSDSENSYEALKVWKYFHSPRFPAKYPAHIKCFYKFIGRRNSHVQVAFEEINIPKGENGCDLDKLIIYDSESANTNKIVDVLCDFPPVRVFLSSGPDLIIEFNASSNTTAKGFRGKFRFVQNEVIVIDTQQYVKTTEGNQSRIPNYENEKIGNTQGDCKFIYDSNSNKTGVFDTNQVFTIQHIRLAENNILFRAVEPIECTYEFYGQGEERVQIKFLDFNIPSESQNSSNCYANNSLQLLTGVRESKYEVTDMYCGRFLPKPIMSKGTKLALQFIGKYPISQYDDNGKGIYYGFKAEYRFLTNYGIVDGHQLGYDCIFTYNSTERKSGLFMSPNFPGFYPQNIICHFYFYGALEERIVIQFDFFDVEGIGSCEYLTASDYVEFSNFMSTDRKYRKFCGKREKFNIRSDDRFFRVSLYTNDRFDRSGFRAYYSFESKAKSSDNTSAQGFMISQAESSKLTVYLETNRLILFMLLCLLY